MKVYICICRHIQSKRKKYYYKKLSPFYVHEYAVIMGELL